MIWIKPFKFYGRCTAALVLGSVVFCTLALFVPYMGFDSDCFGLVFFCSLRDGFWDHLAHLGKSIQTSYVSLNDLGEHQEGLLTYYRPFMTLFHYLSYNLFGVNGTAYFFCNVALHAIASSFLFILYSNFVSSAVAVLLTLFFAFHPALITSYVGVTSHVVPTYVFFFGMLLAYRSFLATHRFFRYIVAAFLFLASLLCYEIVIVFPFVLLLFYIMFDRKNVRSLSKLFSLSMINKNFAGRCHPGLRAGIHFKIDRLAGYRIKSGMTSYNRFFGKKSEFFQFRKRSILQKTYLFFVVLVGYSLMRICLLGRVSSNETSLFSPINLLMRAISNWHQAIKPFWGMQEFSKFVPASLTFLLLALVAAHFFIEQRARKKIFFLSITFFAFAWPVSIVTGDGRYFYLAIPCLGLMLVDALLWLQKKLSVPVVIPVMTALIAWGFVHAHGALAQRSDLTFKRDQAFKQLVKRYGQQQDLNLVMLGTLHCYKSETLLMQQGMSQAARLFFDNKNLQAFHVTQAKICASKQPTQSFTIESIDGGYRFISPDPDNLFFMVPHGWHEGDVIPFSMGRICVYAKSANWKAHDISFIFSDSWLNRLSKSTALFVMFDPTTWSFVTLDSNHLFTRKDVL
jgi:hypothetical protein